VNDMCLDTDDTKLNKDSYRKEGPKKNFCIGPEMSAGEQKEGDQESGSPDRILAPLS